MFGTFRTLVAGANARTEERLRDVYAIELIDQKIRDAEASVKAAKATLATLIQRSRHEQRHVDGLKSQIKDMTQRAQGALDAGQDDLATHAANAIAQMENELRLRETTVDRLETKTMQLRTSVEAGTRRIIDLKQGAVQAKAVRREQNIQSKLNSTVCASSSVDDAEELIAQVIGKDDPFEQSEILREINEDMNHTTIADRLASHGFGPATKTTADDVLSRLKTTQKSA